MLGKLLLAKKDSDLTIHDFRVSCVHQESFYANILILFIIYNQNTAKKLKMKSSRLLTHQIAANFFFTTFVFIPLFHLTCVQAEDRSYFYSNWME